MEEMNVSIGIFKIIRQLKDSIKQNIEEEFGEMDITGTQGMLVGTLAHEGEMKISELSAKMGLSNSTVSGMIDRLEKQGMVERSRSEDDRRVVNVRVTANLRKAAKSHFTAIENKIESILNEATPEEVQKVVEGFQILKELLNRQK